MSPTLEPPVIQIGGEHDAEMAKNHGTVLVWLSQMAQNTDTALKVISEKLDSVLSELKDQGKRIGGLETKALENKHQLELVRRDHADLDRLVTKHIADHEIAMKEKDRRRYELFTRPIVVWVVVGILGLAVVGGTITGTLYATRTTSGTAGSSPE
ncbi:MAG: hypothetical protein P1V51_20020 [Deltaproteobacteria bacterium]|nr:hypothetical protein [Deltaproteobacteria bacterium]